MQLEDEQYELLVKFVEAHRSAPRELRGSFIGSVTHNKPEATFLHSRVRDLRFEGSISDAEVLADLGLLRMSSGSSESPTFTVLPQGIHVYEGRRRSFSPVDIVSEEPPKFLSESEFRTAHSKAYEKWRQAADLMWSADSTQNLTTIGHLCREALQEFAASLAFVHEVDVSEIEPAKTVARLKQTLDACPVRGKTRKALLDKMLVYWRAVSDLVQRQEHGAQREGEDLVWEDARCVVFQTCIVMFEFHRGVR